MTSPAAPSTTSLLERVLQRRLLPPGSAVVLGVSGGADSVALLALLAEGAAAQKWQLTVGHLDHGLRGLEGRADEEFVVDLCTRLGVTCRAERIDVLALARELGQGVEAAGRTARYRFLARVAEEAGAGRVAVAHTLDDQSETVLLRILRGAGLRGLRGILPVRPIHPGSPILLVRPLLGVRRQELLDWVAHRGLAYRIDATNADPRFMRNRVRHEVLPELRRVFRRDPSISLARLADTSIAAWDAAEGRARDFWDRAPRDAGGDLLAEEAALAAVPEAFRVAVWMEGIRRIKGNLAGVTAGHYDRLERASAAPGPFRLDLGSAVRIEWEHGRFRLSRGQSRAVALPGPTPFPLPGRVNVEALRLSITAELREAVLANLAGAFALKETREEYVDADRLRGALCLRPRRPEDRFQPLGAPGHKSLRKFLMNKKVPRSERERVLLVADDEGPIWVLGHTIADRVKLTAETRRIVRFELLPWD